MRLSEFRGLVPKSLFGGLAPQNCLTMVIMIILPQYLPSVVSPPLLTNMKKIN
jgi:hypothetical protein